MTLRERIEAELDRKQAIAEGVPPLPANNWRGAATAFAHWTDEASRAIERHIAFWSPAAVLAGLAEDRDVLKRHEHRVIHGLDCCVGCSILDESDGRVVVLVPAAGCREIASLARRHGISS